MPCCFDSFADALCLHFDPQDLIKYMHANPVQVPDDDNDDLKVSDSWTTREAAVLKNSTQDLQGFGNPGKIAHQ